MGTETTSPIYTTMVSGPVVAVFHESQRRGHSELTGEARTWLKTHWVIQALAALDTSISSATAIVQGSPVSVGSNVVQCPVTISIPGTRTVPESPARFPTHTFLSMALGLGTGGNRCDTGEGAWWPIQVALKAANVQQGESLTPDQLGLTIEEANTLVQVTKFRTIDDYVAASTLFDKVNTIIHPNHKPPTTYTYVRTAEGVVSYFGSWEDGAYDGYSTNGNKAAIYAERITNDGAFVWSHPEAPEPKTNKCTVSCPSGRVGYEACTQVGGKEICLDFADLYNSGVAYIIEWNQENGLELIAPIENDPENNETCRWERLFTQGGYDIMVRNPNNPEIMVGTVANPPANECYAKKEGDTHAIRFTSGPFPAEVGLSEVYFRDKTGNKGVYQTRILVQGDQNGWVFNGDPSVTYTAQPDTSQGQKCWACSQTDYKCTSLNLRVLYDDIPECVPLNS